MSTISKSLILTCLVLPLFLSAQNTSVDAALDKGNATGLSPFLAKSMDLLILKDEITVTAQQATTMLADFFAKAGVRGYKQNHVTTSPNGSSTYTIGDLTTDKGNYRVSIFYDAAKKISEIRIEK